MHQLITNRLNRKLFKRIANFLLFYIGWGFCLSGAIEGDIFTGPIVALAFVLYHLVLERFKRSEVLLILSLGIFGTLLDSSYAYFGLIVFKGGYPGFPYIAPLWVTSIWMLFASSVTPSFGWLKQSVLLAAVMGFGGGFASYFAAARVGAATFYPGTFSLSVLIGVLWAVLMPLILKWASFLEGQEPQPS